VLDICPSAPCPQGACSSSSIRLIRELRNSEHSSVESDPSLIGVSGNLSLDTRCPILEKAAAPGSKLCGSRRAQASEPPGLRLRKEIVNVIGKTGARRQKLQILRGGGIGYHVGGSHYISGSTGGEKLEHNTEAAGTLMQERELGKEGDCWKSIVTRKEKIMTNGRGA